MTERKTATSRFAEREKVQTCPLEESQSKNCSGEGRSARIRPVAAPELPRCKLGDRSGMNRSLVYLMCFSVRRRVAQGYESSGARSSVRPANLGSLRITSTPCPTSADFCIGAGYGRPTAEDRALAGRWLAVLGIPADFASKQFVAKSQTQGERQQERF